MASWAGFSDEDLRRMKSDNVTSDASDESFEPVIKPVGLGRAYRKQPVRQMNLLGKYSKVCPGENSISTSARLSNTIIPSGLCIDSAANTTNTTDSLKRSKDFQNVRDMPNNTVVTKQPSDVPAKQSLHRNGTSVSPALVMADTERSSKAMMALPDGPHNSLGGKEMVQDDLVLDANDIVEKELSKLEHFQQQQKMIEELNKQKKQLLTNAIKERCKQAQAEASKLSHIQTELGHLDNQLTADVSHIRDRIEGISREYLEAQKRYIKAEQEFVASKTELYKKADMKERLTEHLYTIIHQNELRKSLRLAEMMKQLELVTADGDIDNEISLPELPPLSAFTTCTLQTFPIPRSPGSPTSVGMFSFVRDNKDENKNDMKSDLNTKSASVDNLNVSHPSSRPRHLSDSSLHAAGVPPCILTKNNFKSGSSNKSVKSVTFSEHIDIVEMEPVLSPEETEMEANQEQRGVVAVSNTADSTIETSVSISQEIVNESNDKTNQAIADDTDNSLTAASESSSESSRTKDAGGQDVSEPAPNISVDSSKSVVLNGQNLVPSDGNEANSTSVC